MPPPSPDPVSPCPEPRCPMCSRPAVAAQRPFCSPRCRDRDLLQWLGDGYALPGAAVDNGLDSGEGYD